MTGAEPPVTAFEAVLLDMDGVLCDSEALLAEAAIDLFREDYGLAVDRDDFLPFVGAGESRFLTGVGEAHGVRIPMPEAKDRLYAYYLERIPGRLQPLPGVGEFIAAARRRGCRLAVATSADRVKLEGNLAAIGLAADRLDACISGDRIGRLKPDPEIFLTAAAAVGAEPGRCLVVEDAVLGIRAGRSAGCACLGITSSFDAAALTDAGAHWTAPDLHGALAALGWAPAASPRP